jgi:AraC-like DNA-binding protein
LLGFSHVTAFYKAFRRWSGGATPVEYRTSVHAQVTPRRRRA